MTSVFRTFCLPFVPGSALPIAMSPWKQRPAHHIIRGYIFNGYRRLSGQFVYWSIPFALGMSLIHATIPMRGMLHSGG